VRLGISLERANRLHPKERALVELHLSLSSDIANVISIEGGKCQEYLLFVLGNEKASRKVISMEIQSAMAIIMNRPMCWIVSDIRIFCRGFWIGADPSSHLGGLLHSDVIQVLLSTRRLHFNNCENFLLSSTGMTVTA
jgi:hypothetical protein